MDYYQNTAISIDTLFAIVPLAPFRHTPGVVFDLVPRSLITRINAIDRVMHESAAISPGPIGATQRPWYMHPHQDDNLIVMHGTRHVDLYRKPHGRIESFEVTPDRISRNGTILHQGAAMLVWPSGVFHRIQSGTTGSASLNFAVHYQGFDIRNNFNIYDLDPESGVFRVIRRGEEDQQAYTEVTPTETG